MGIVGWLGGTNAVKAPIAGLDDDALLRARIWVGERNFQPPQAGGTPAQDRPINHDRPIIGAH